MTMRTGQPWVPTPMPLLPAVEAIFDLLADNTTGEISAHDMRDVVDYILSLRTAQSWSVTTHYFPGQVVKDPASASPNDLYVLTGPDVTGGLGPGLNNDPNWVPLSSLTPERVVVTATAGETPATAGVLPAGAAPVSGDWVWNTTDRAFFLFDGTVWQRLETSVPLVTTTATAGSVPANPVAPQTLHPWAAGHTAHVGDFFINNGDQSAWVYDGATWQPIPSHTPSITLESDKTRVPTNAVVAASLPGVRGGDFFFNTALGQGWVYDAARTQWDPIPHSTTVTVATTVGADPITNPPAVAPQFGDLYLNEMDKSSWVWAPNTAGTAAGRWMPLSEMTGNVYLSDTTGETPTTYVFPPHTRLSEGDRFVNRVDRIAWVYAPDPNKVGSMIWVEIPTENKAINSAIPGETPTTHTFAAPPRVGDIFTNSADNLAWAYSLDMASNTPAWQPLATSGHVWVAYNQGEDPRNPGAVVLPPEAQLSVGDIFINHLDGFGFVWTGTDWEDLPLSPPPTVTVSYTAGEDPTLVPDPRSGDTFINYEDGLAWAYDGIDWDQYPSPPEEVITTSTTAGVTPASHTAAGWGTTPPFIAGDIFINTADNLSWVYGGTSWIPLPQRPEAVTVVSINNVLPTTHTWAAGVVHVSGDTFINQSDNLAWVYDGTSWIALPAAERPLVTVASAKGLTPAVPTAGATQPLSGQRDDVFINSADRLTWIHDGTSWIPIPAAERPQVTVSAVRGDTPTRHIASMGQWVYDATMQAAIGVGAIEIRNPGSRAAIVFFHADHTGADRSSMLATISIGDVVRIRDSATLTHGWDVTVTNVTHTHNPPPGSEDLLLLNGSTTAVGTAPADGTLLSIEIPASQIIPTRDDVFVNTTDGTTWIYDGTQWVELVRTGLPATTGHAVGDALTIVNPASGALGWAPAAAATADRVIGSRDNTHEMTWATFCTLPVGSVAVVAEPTDSTAHSGGVTAVSVVGGGAVPGNIIPTGSVVRRWSVTEVDVWLATTPYVLHGTSATPPAAAPNGAVYYQVQP